MAKIEVINKTDEDITIIIKKDEEDLQPVVVDTVDVAQVESGELTPADQNTQDAVDGVGKYAEAES